MFTEYNLLALIVIIISYLLGSIPTAYMIARLHKVNIFDIGSGNMGATNVARVLGMRWALGVMFIDMLKGVIAIAISRQIMPDSKAAATTISAIAVISGHNWSLFATILTGTLRGGKGAATALGTFLMIAPAQVIVSMFVIGIVIVARTRYVSLAVLVAFGIGLLWMNVLILQQQLPSQTLIYTLLLAALLIIRLKGNIQRLLAGTERRLGDRA